MRQLALPALLGAALAAPSIADAGKFTSPYHRPDLKWYTIETDHFFVHYPVSKKDAEAGNQHYIDSTWAARKMATVADEMYEPMCREFDYYLTEKVNIVLLDHPDELEGFTIPAWNWIEISANPGGYFYRMRGRMEWFADVLVHEFAHVVSLKENAPLHEDTFGVLFGGLYQDGVNDMQQGAQFLITSTDPFWWTEGGAEYWSDNTGYNWWTPSRDANLRNTVLEERTLTYDEWITRVEKRDWGDGERGYQQGYSFALYLRERFGDETYAEFAEVSSQRWRPNWETIVEEVTGVHLEQLYDDWVAYLQEKYGKVQAGVEAEGRVEGRELITSRGGWEWTDPAGKDAWTPLDPKQRGEQEDTREGTGGTWDLSPRYSSDGKWYGEHYRGRLHVKRMDEELWPAFSGHDLDGAANADAMQQASDLSGYLPMAFGHSFDFVPGRDAAVVTGFEDMLKDSAFRIETDGYDWNQLWLVDLTPELSKKKRKHRGTRERYETLQYTGKQLKQHYTPIPNTQRGNSPIVSPDGEKVAYLQYNDGTLNLVTINLDGTEKKWLTEFHDGTWMQNPDWSPDGKHIVVSIFRNFQQDLYIVDAETGELTALTRDSWESQDSWWADDGWIYFSSDPTDIFNIYRIHPETKEVQQITNVVGAAECPSITPDGNLLYTNFTGHGWKGFGLSRDEFMLKPVDYFGVEVDHDEVAEELAYSEDLSYWEERTRPYNPVKNFRRPSIIPIFRVENDSRTNLGLQGGFQFDMMDFEEDHSLFGYALLGEDPVFAGGYTYTGWYPEISVFAQHVNTKFDYGLLIDDDDDTSTTDDQTFFDQKQHQYVNAAGITVDYPWNNHVSTGISFFGLQYGFKGVSDADFQPFLRNASLGLNYQFSNVWGSWATLNPHGGHHLTIDVDRTYSDLLYAPYQGRDTDDGQILSEYWFNRAEVNWAAHLPAPTFGLKALQGVREKQHTLQLNANLGYVDRNVQFQNEFRAGGTHPYFVGPGSIQPNNQFAGYPGFSLSGETMVVLSGAYRFPIATKINQKIGPLYIWDVFAQVGGTGGNLWSFRPPEEGDASEYYYDGFGQRVAYDPSDVRREIPFVDVAYKNGNRILWDANAELRVGTNFMNASFMSFVRVAYAFNEISGINDVDGDDISDTTDPGTGNSLSTETEKPGPRIFIGLGTGW